jgi:hypothetical protein
MNDIPDSREQERKSWTQVLKELRCPIIGVCLTMGEQRRILRKARVSPKELEDKEVHGLLVQSGSSDNALARRVQRRLDAKYHREIREWGVCEEPELLARWEAGLRRGEIGAVLWIAATHPSLSHEAISRVFSDAHMLMHRQGELVVQELQQGERLRAQNEQLRDKLRKAQASRRETAQALEASQKARAELELELARVRKAPKQDERVDSYRARLQKAERQIETKDAVIERLKAEKERLEAENERMLTELASVKELNNVMRAEWQDMLTNLQQADDTCQTCPEYDLCDRRVLLVGGMTRLRAAYQALVEDMGGEFQHHDGRNSGGDRVLTGMVRWADVVLCPVDVNSHGACLSIKTACKKMNKPYHMLPSSGVSSVARALAEYCRPVEQPRL